MTPTSPSSSPSAASGKSVWTSGIGGRPPTDRQPLAEARAQQAAAGEGMQRLDDLVARPERVGERIDPDVDAIADVLEQVRHEGAAGQEQDEPDDDEAEPPGRGIGQRQEHREEQQRRTEVALDHDDAERDRPHRDHRGEVRQGRQAKRADARVLFDEHRSVLREVAGEEHHEDDLQQLGRLTADRPEAQRQPLARNVSAEHEGQEQQRDPDRRPRVLVAAQPAVGPDHDADRRGHGDGEDEPDQLDIAEAQRGLADLEGHEVLRQPLHEQQRDAAEEPDDRQQDLVRAPAGEDLGDVGHGEGPEIDDQRDGLVRRERPVDGQVQRYAPHDQRQAGEGQETRLGPAQTRSDRTQDAGAG